MLSKIWGFFFGVAEPAKKRYPFRCYACGESNVAKIRQPVAEGETHRRYRWACSKCEKHNILTLPVEKHHGEDRK